MDRIRKFARITPQEAEGPGFNQGSLVSRLLTHWSWARGVHSSREPVRNAGSPLRRRPAESNLRVRGWHAVI